MQRFSAQLLALLSLLQTGLAASQDRQKEPAQCSGKLTGIAPKVLQVETEKGERFLVAIPPRREDISFQGSATPAFLGPGMLVQFRAIFDKKGASQGQVSEIKVVSPRPGVKLELKADGMFSGGDLFASDDEKNARKKKKGRSETAPFLVSAVVRSLKDGQMSLLTGGPIVSVELSNDCKVSFDIWDLSLIRDGDRVEVAEGWRYADQSTQMYARRLIITAEKTLGSDEKRRRPSTKTEDKKSDSKKPDKTEKVGTESGDKKD